MSKETTVNLTSQIVTTTFKTKCNLVDTELNILFDFSNLTQEEVYELALRSAVIDFQRLIRPLTSGEARKTYNNSTVTVGEKRKKVVSLSTRAFNKFNKGEELTLDEAKALREAYEKFTGITKI